jgi:hypothetical protein
VSILRDQLFSSAPWFESLTEGDESMWPVWRITRSAEPGWWVGMLECASWYARQHHLLDHYRKRLGAISKRDLTIECGEAEGRSSTDPIWQIVNELIVAHYLEQVLSWRFVAHEPCGRQCSRGDWLMRTPSGRTAFVEVKTILEPPVGASGVYSAPVVQPRLRNVLKGAYSRLPRDDDGKVVVLIGSGEILRITHGILGGSVFATLFGQLQVRFNVSLGGQMENARLTPSFREMFVQPEKHRSLGTLAVLPLHGMDDPSVGFYAIHNPFSDGPSRIPREDWKGARQA